ncbi:hypothetical protein [Pseudothauera lacus]|uniref:Uncharacterized protein n=1 Tax=Pseudothauera lacus TaxID=2136175 RepID=A0A2T4IF41_9RHOO|nr:hypothetical protein [Pseudothauera lacus]PTD96394.1 hypothetical protein C8261_08735 [Pseudothauera lacus]
MSSELVRRAAAGDFSPEVAAWLAEGMRKHLAGDDLQHSLGLDRASRVRERNKALQEAAELLAGDDDPWRCAGRLEAAVKRFEARILPLLLRDPQLPISPVDKALRRAFDSGLRVPGTARNLYELIR